MRKRIRFLASVTLLIFAYWAPPANAARTEVRLAPFGPMWSRDSKSGTAELDAATLLQGQPTLHVRHAGDRDWSLAPGGKPIPVRSGELLELHAAVRIAGTGQLSISFNSTDSVGNTLDWQAAERTTDQNVAGFQMLQTRFVVPAGVAFIRPRLTGVGPIEAWVGGWAMYTLGAAAELRQPGLPTSLTIENVAIRVTLNTTTGSFSVTDLRNQRTWQQQPLGGDLMVTDARRESGELLHLSLLDVSNDRTLTANVQLTNDEPEFAVVLHSDPTQLQTKPIAFPQPFVTEPGTYLVIPMNEGISYPVDDPNLSEMNLITYGGHGICMSFFGAADQTTGAAYSAIIETADDADIRIAHAVRPGHPSILCVALRWEPQKGRFGYDRTIRYSFFTRGAHVAIAKRYRRYAKDIGRFKNLADKRKTVPAIDQLVGAVNVWCWGGDPVAIVKQMQSAGIDRILWSNASKPQQLRVMNSMNVLTSRYDIYQDVMDPSVYPQLAYIHPDWTTPAWPKELIHDQSGQPIKGWEIERKDGTGMVPCGVVCDSRAIPYALDRITRDLQTHPYGCRFIDTTTASPYRECYDPRHSMTRTDSRLWKMRLLDTVSNHFHLVCGSETGHDAAVPYADYFEGMLSLGPYRVADAGRNVQDIVQDVPAQISTFQLGERYRLPLWELVYHDASSPTGTGATTTTSCRPCGTNAMNSTPCTAPPICSCSRPTGGSSTRRASCKATRPPLQSPERAAIQK